MKTITAKDGRVSITVSGNSRVSGITVDGDTIVDDDVTVVGEDGEITVRLVRQVSWLEVTRRVCFYAACLAFCLLCWWGIVLGLTFVLHAGQALGR